MSGNEVLRDADRLSLPVPVGTKAGAPVRCGGMVGVALTDRAQSVGNLSASDYNAGGGNAEGYATVGRNGSARLLVAGAVTAVGTVVHLLADGTLSVSPASDSYPFGFALEVKAAAPAAINVAISQRPDRLVVTP